MQLTSIAMRIPRSRVTAILFYEKKKFTRRRRSAEGDIGVIKQEYCSRGCWMGKDFRISDFTCTMSVALVGDSVEIRENGIDIYLRKRKKGKKDRSCAHQ